MSNKTISFIYGALLDVCGIDKPSKPIAKKAAMAAQDILTQGLVNDECAAIEVRRRADCYRALFPTVALTPMALANNWYLFADTDGRSTRTKAQQAAWAKEADERKTEKTLDARRNELAKILLSECDTLDVSDAFMALKQENVDNKFYLQLLEAQGIAGWRVTLCERLRPGELERRVGKEMT